MEKEGIGIEMRDAQHTAGYLTRVSRGKGGRLKSVYLRTLPREPSHCFLSCTLSNRTDGVCMSLALSLLSEQVHTESPKRLCWLFFRGPSKKILNVRQLKVEQNEEKKQTHGISFSLKKEVSFGMCDHIGKPQRHAE